MISLTPFFSHGAGQYNFFWGPICQYRPRLWPFIQITPFVYLLVSMNVSATVSSVKVPLKMPPGRSAGARLLGSAVTHCSLSGKGNICQCVSTVSPSFTLPTIPLRSCSIAML